MDQQFRKAFREPLKSKLEIKAAISGHVKPL